MRVSVSVSDAYGKRGDEQTSSVLFAVQDEFFPLLPADAELGVLLFARSFFLLSRFVVHSAQNHSFVSSLTASSEITGS